MSENFLGVGWKFPIEADAEEGKAGPIATAEYEHSIQQSIWMILGTAKGERVMRPDFGCGIHDLVFAVNGSGTSGRVTSSVQEALIKWEPRIEILNVANFPEGNRLLIEIEYRIRATNSRYNLVYPFYLE